MLPILRSTSIRHALIALLVCAGALTLAGPSTIAGAGRQSAAVPQLPRDVKLSAADVTRLADEARKGVTVEIPPNFELKLWAPDALIVDPVALEFDEKGTVYATSTSRNNMPLDIREHPTWVPTVHTLKTVADLREFYEKELAPAAQREEPVAAGSQPGRIERYSRSRHAEGAALPHPGHGR